jgi:zinc transport system permease protein
VLEPFLLRSLAAGIGLAIFAAPLGCFVVWQRMALIGETIAHAGLIGVALGLILATGMTTTILAVAVLVGALLVALSRQQMVPLDSILGLLAHAALAIGIILASLVGGPPVDLMAFLFGDIFAVNLIDLAWIYGGGLVIVTGLALLWQPLLQIALHADLAVAEGIDINRVRLVFTLLLAVMVAVAMKIVGALLIIAFLIMPAVAARPFATTPERMAILAALIGCAGVVGGLALSLWGDVPGGPAIVAVLAAIAFAALAIGTRSKA